MNQTDVKEKISKLPVWARDYIQDLERRREQAVRTLNEHVDQETPAPFYYEAMPVTGEGRGPTTKRFYIQSRTVTCEFDGIELDISAHHFNNQRGIRLQWTVPGLRVDEVALIPESFQAVRLISKKDMR